MANKIRKRKLTCLTQTLLYNQISKRGIQASVAQHVLRLLWLNDHQNDLQSPCISRNTSLAPETWWCYMTSRRNAKLYKKKKGKEKQRWSSILVYSKIRLFNEKKYLQKWMETRICIHLIASKFHHHLISYLALNRSVHLPKKNKKNQEYPNSVTYVVR